MKDSQLNMRIVAAGLYGIAGCDATPEQIKQARKAVRWHQEGKSISLILLLLRIPRKSTLTSNLLNIPQLPDETLQTP